MGNWLLPGLREVQSRSSRVGPIGSTAYIGLGDVDEVPQPPWEKPICCYFLSNGSILYLHGSLPGTGSWIPAPLSEFWNAQADYHGSEKAPQLLL